MILPLLTADRPGSEMPDISGNMDKPYILLMFSELGAPSPLQSCTASLQRLLHETEPEAPAWAETIGLLRAFIRADLAGPGNPETHELRFSARGSRKASIALILVDALTNTDPGRRSTEQLQVLAMGMDLLERPEQPNETEERALYSRLLSAGWQLTPAFDPAEFESFVEHLSPQDRK